MVSPKLLLGKGLVWKLEIVLLLYVSFDGPLVFILLGESPNPAPNWVLDL
jgi:hypothetical protein